MSAASHALEITAAALSAGVAGCFYAAFSPTCSFFGPVILRGPRTGPPRVAITFDDGPYPAGTAPILDTLARERVPATFFFIGRNIEAHPDLARRAIAEGHLVGNHSFDHSRWGVMRRQWYWDEQFELTDRAIEATGGPSQSRFFRPPMGFKTWRMSLAARSRGLSIVAWSLRGMDGVPTTADSIARRILPRVQPGDIIALHDGIEPGIPRDPGATVAALPRLIDGIRRKGLEPVRLDTLLESP